MIIHRLGDKVNFVDGNNILVGYDTMQDCCEHARWWLSEVPDVENQDEERGRDLGPYFFDPLYVQVAREPVRGGADYDEGGHITFRLLAEDMPPLYLTLANSHNGYYGHGFEVEIGGQSIWGGCL